MKISWIINLTIITKCYHNIYIISIACIQQCFNGVKGNKGESGTDGLMGPEGYYN